MEFGKTKISLLIAPGLPGKYQKPFQIITNGNIINMFVYTHGFKFDNGKIIGFAPIWKNGNKFGKTHKNLEKVIYF